MILSKPGRHCSYLLITALQLCIPPYIHWNVDDNFSFLSLYGVYHGICDTEHFNIGFRYLDMHFNKNGFIWLQLNMFSHWHSMTLSHHFSIVVQFSSPLGSSCTYLFPCECCISFICVLDVELMFYDERLQTFFKWTYRSANTSDHSAYAYSQTVQV